VVRVNTKFLGHSPKALTNPPAFAKSPIPNVADIAITGARFLRSKAACRRDNRTSLPMSHRDAAGAALIDRNDPHDLRLRLQR
jgi:hypothetical protein